MLSSVEILILSIIQGFSEFIPVSSAAHLVLISRYYDFLSQNLLIDICLHLGSLIAIIFYYRKDLFNFIQNKTFLIRILIGTIPIIPVGYIFYQTGLINHIRNLEVIGWTSLIFGVLLYIIAWRSNIKEVVNVTEEKIRIEIGRNGPEKTYELDKTWAKVVLERSWNNWYPSRLLLRSHGRQIEIGKFLNEQERQCLGAELKKVINN